MFQEQRILKIIPQHYIKSATVFFISISNTPSIASCNFYRDFTCSLTSVSIIRKVEPTAALFRLCILFWWYR